MRRLPYLIIAVLFLALLLPFVTLQTQAGNLSNTTLRLDRSKTNTATGGIVCAQTPSSNNGTVAKVAVTFPAGFTVNSNAANWTVTTSNLPAGATSWPGIGTANSVAGQTVTFPSSSLSTSTYYCFNFAGSGTLTTGGTGTDQNGTIATKTSGNSIVDSKEYGVHIVANDQINVTATVAANPTDFSADLASDDTPATYPQNTTLSYTLTYGSNLSYSGDLTVEAEWSLGTIAGSGSPTVDLLDYVVGSASDAYNSTPPIIDTVNRKISWNISSFPAATTDQTVTFKLKTNSSYTGASQVSFTTTGRVLGPGTQTADSNINQNYQYVVPITPTPTPSPTPTADPTSAPGSSTATPGPAATTTPVPTESLSFGNISVNTINQSGAGIFINTSIPTSIKILYGTAINNLSNSVNIQTLSTNHLITLPGLKPNTTYFYKVIVTGGGKSITSDIFTFTTAVPSTPLEVNLQTLVLTSNSNFLISNFTNSQQATSGAKTSVAVLPVHTPYQFVFSLKENQAVKRIRALLRNRNTLGASTADAVSADNLTNVEIQEVQPGVYSGTLTSQPNPGNYDLYVQIFDENGNVQEQKIAEIRIVPRFGVFDKTTGVPIENAIALFYSYNPKNRIYSIIPAGTLGIKNPSNTLYDGTVSVVLAAGRYKVNVNALGYKETDIEFAIDGSADGGYPQVRLEKQPFSILNTLIYYAGTAFDVLTSTNSYFADLSKSIRFFDLIALVAMLLLVVTTVFSFSLRTHIPLLSIPVFFLHYVSEIVGIEHVDYVRGQINDEKTGKPVTQALVELINPTTGKVLSQTTTNKLGEFILKKIKSEKYKLRASKSGYHHTSIPDFTEHTLVGTHLLHLLKRDDHSLPSVPILLFRALENLFGFLFELLLFFSLGFEILFFNTAGILRTAPFIVVTVLTIILWLAYARRVIRRASSSTY